MINHHTRRGTLAGKTLLALLLTTVYLVATAQNYIWAPDFPVGAEFPELAAQDQNGSLRTFDDLVGENGMLFMMSRSFDW